jgi:DNA-binding IclR family transcriptional regulator
MAPARPSRPTTSQVAARTERPSARPKAPKAVHAPLPGGQLTTVTNTLRLLQQFTFEEPVLGVSELARRLGTGKSTVHRMLTTLVAEGFVMKTPDDRYRLGFKLYELGQLVVHTTQLRDVAHPFLEDLRNESAEAAQISVLDGIEVVYVERFESPSTLRLFGRIGRRMPAHATSSGKCLLAHAPSEVVDAVIANGLRRLAPRTITTGAVLQQALAETRERGYAVSFEESEIGVASVGAPVFGHDGKAVAAISVAGPSLRMTLDAMPRYTRLVTRAAGRISAALGYVEH